MVRLDLLNSALTGSGLKRRFVASTLGLTPKGLANKVSGESEFKIGEVHRLSELLHLSPADKERIFFADESDGSSSLT